MVTCRYIEKRELREFFNLGFDEEDESLVKSMISEGDKDKDNVISFDEFKEIIDKLYHILI